jgi:predicted RNA-binding protein with PIN domain
VHKGEIAISHIIIDGYNVIGIFHKDMEQARDRFVNLLINYRKIKAHDITVVFDGYKSGGAEHVSVSGGVRIIYSRLGEKADDVIKRIISSDRKEEWIVVSNDRDIAKHAWSVHSIPVPSEEFLDIISRQAEQIVKQTNLPVLGQTEKETVDGLAHKDFEEDEYAHVSKGNPYQLSKKDKAIRRALGKL